MKGASVAVGAAGMALAAGIKGVCRSAGADALMFILAPSSWLARHLGGIDLRYEQGAGFISHAERLVVGAACAGVSFFVAAFVTVFLAYLSRFEGARAKLAWLFGALIVAYVATILANGLRIAVSARLYVADIYGGAVTAERVHRVAGTVIYYGSLLALTFGVGAALGAHGRRRFVGLVPLACYLAVATGIPLVGRAWAAAADSGRFVEHVAWVAGTALLLSGVGALLGRLRNRLQWRT